MQKLKYSINTTLDGCCDHESVIPTQEMHEHAANGIEQASILLFGRIVYDMMESAWRPVAETGVKPEWMDDWMVPFAHTIHKAKKYVVSNTLKQVDWNAEIIRGDELKNKVLQLKQQPGRGILTGGVTLPLKLAELGLIDEYEFIVHPRLIGHGPKLLDGLSKAIDLKLVNKKEFKSGAFVLSYEPTKTK
ncbi:dihydrofolate reductase family protein [Bdellovibrio reynosensis]|uniref:Dihydrofolate reductase family protein n=1 Tax=Bdellovibrio reynosensis TaxID=2835041 RepID=A0ABY4C815_9BACT|nr:dihydrofolate reductase family protein [Bdellovibrio reynosensis]UOF00614.1 dihydrofolate reductase family protein [Bdellovibrio reynosensis]